MAWFWKYKISTNVRIFLISPILKEYAHQLVKCEGQLHKIVTNIMLFHVTISNVMCVHRQMKHSSLRQIAKFDGNL